MPAIIKPAQLPIPIPAEAEVVAVAESLARATTLLRAECYLAVVLDQYLLETEADEAGTTLEHMGTAILVQVNLAISGMERLVREVRAAVRRRQREEVRARHAAVGKLHSELNGTVTALLLSIELALETPRPGGGGRKAGVGSRTGAETPKAIGGHGPDGRSRTRCPRVTVPALGPIETSEFALDSESSLSGVHPDPK